MKTKAYAYARAKGLSEEDAEDFSQWKVLTELEGAKTKQIHYKFIDYLRLKHGRIGSYKNRSRMTRRLYEEDLVGVAFECAGDFRRLILATGVSLSVADMVIKYYFEGYSLREIGDMMGRSPAYVCVKLQDFKEKVMALWDIDQSGEGA